MKIVSILIELEREEHDLPTHAQHIVFRDGTWTANGGVYSRVTPALHTIWTALRSAMRGRPVE